MPMTRTRDHGPVHYEESDTLQFVRPLAGFAHLDRFLLLRPAEAGPWIVLQSLQSADTAFWSLPVKLLAPGYELQLAADDRSALGWPSIPADPLALALVAIGEDGRARANLLGPVVVDPASRRAVQAIREDRKYGAAEDVESWLAAREAPSCS